MVVLFFIIANVEYGIAGIPMGWDTSYYVAWMRLLQQYGIILFSSSMGYWHILYPIVGVAIGSAGLGVLKVEIYLPLVLALFTVVATTALADKLFEDRMIVILTPPFVASWFALYRMGADFHVQLLALPFLLLATRLLLVTRQTERNIVCLAAFAGLTVTAGLAHIELTMFFIVLWVFTFILIDRMVGGSLAFTRRAEMVISSSVLVSPAALPALASAQNVFLLQKILRVSLWRESGYTQALEA